MWQNVPFVFLLLYASLQSVSENQYEAARIDGAGFFQQFWYITLPNIKGSLALCALLRTIDTFRLFEKVNVLTGGGRRAPPRPSLSSCIHTVSSLWTSASAAPAPS